MTDKIENISKYDPTRKTVGAIYRDAQLNNSEDKIINGDLTHEFMNSLVEDLNTTIASNPYQGKPFYIMVHEKKDLQMKQAILRRMIVFKFRPYPEDDTMVFWVDPATNDVRFCWCLPHWSEMDNILMNHNLFEPEIVAQIKYWKSYDLHAFGFTKDDMGNWIPNPKWKDKPLAAYKPKAA